jgi:hypothetical protein
MAKLKALGLVGAAFAVGVAFAAPSTPATTGGHFTTGAQHTTWLGVAEDVNVIAFPHWGVGCEEVEYVATTTFQTTESLTVTPRYVKCRERLGEEESKTEIAINTNECNFLFTIGKKAEADNTGHLVCPPGKRIEVFLVNATIMLPPQTFSGISYKATAELGVNTLTMTFTASGLVANCEGGIYCLAGGTNWTAQLAGSLKMRGSGTDGLPVGIRATGSEG